MPATRHVLAICSLLFGVTLLPACGGEPEQRPPPTAQELFEGHEALGDEERFEEAAGVLDRLQQLALGAKGTSEDRELLAAAMVHRIVDGLRINQPLWIRDGLAMLQRLASRQDATPPVVHSLAEGLLRAHDHAWTNDDPDTGAELLNDLEALAQATGEDAEVRSAAARAWDRAHLAGVDRSDDSLRTTALEHLRKDAHENGALAAERGAYLAAVERMHKRAVAEDHHLEADVHRKAVRGLLAIGASEASDQAVLVRMLTDAALQQTGQGRTDAAEALIVEASRIATPLLDQEQTEELTPWFRGQQHVIFRTLGRGRQAQDALADLRKRTRADSASVHVLQRMALALAYEMRYASTSEARGELLREMHEVAMRDAADGEVMMSYGRSIQQAALRANEDGQVAETARYLEMLRKGAKEAATDRIRAQLARLLEAVEGDVQVSPDSLPR